MSKEKIIVFEIFAQIKVDIPFSKKVNKYPIHSHFLTKVEKINFIYKYKPDSSLDELEYLDFLKKEFKEKYNALSVEFGTLDNFLRLNSK